jgi:hypothetical protein
MLPRTRDLSLLYRDVIAEVPSLPCRVNSYLVAAGSQSSRKEIAIPFARIFGQRMLQDSTERKSGFWSYARVHFARNPDIKACIVQPQTP